MDSNHETLPPPQTSESPPRLRGVPALAWLHRLVMLLFLAGFGIALMRGGDRQWVGMEEDPNSMEPQSLRAIWKTKPQHERNWQTATTGWYQARAPHATWYGVPPLWPWLMSFGGPPGSSETGGQGLKEDPKNPAPYSLNWEAGTIMRVCEINKWLTLAFLALLAFGVGRQWSLPGTINLLLVLGWMVLRPLQARATPETLSMILFLLTVLAAVRLLLKNTAWRHVHFGVVAGLAYLTDLSIVPLLAAWLLVTTARFLRGMLEKSQEGGWTCRGHFIGMQALVFAFLAVTVPNLHYHHVEDGRALSPVFNHYLNSVPQTTQELHSHTTQSLLTLVKTNAEEIPRAAVQPSRLLILAGLLGLLLIAVARAAGGGGAASRQAGVSIFQESRTVFYFILLAAFFYAALARPGEVLWQVFGLGALVLTMGAEALFGWAGRKGVDGGAYRIVFTGLQLVLSVHLMISIFQYFRALPMPS